MINLLTDVLTKQEEQIAHTIGFVCGIIVGVGALIALIAFFIYACIYYAKVQELKRKYRNNLPEHERYIIHEYEAITWKPKKKVRKQDDYH